MKKKGLSLEESAEKRLKVLEVFHEAKEPFILKEVEKKAAAKGVVLQSVKEVLQSLVDDSMVHQEKIGTQNIFWSFPSEVGQALKAQLSQYEQQLLDLETRRREAEGRVEAQSAGKEDSDERSALVQAVEELRAKDAALKAELADYKDNDPETLKQLLEAAKVARESANRWTDNIWCLQSWCKKKFDGREKELADFFAQNGVGDDFDHVEDK